jgi:DNA-binding transcriptional ArsR family regulator
MHRRVDWMVAADDAVLHLLGQSNLELSARDLAHNLGYDADYMGKRCRRLRREELLYADDEDGGPFYGLADRGKDYLSGNFSPGDLE